MRLGADPEVFLQNKEGKPISVIGYIGADKWSPLQIQDMPTGFTLQEDNVALEYGIPPAATADEFVHHIQAVMERSRAFLPELEFSKLSCIIFPEDQMDHPMAHIFGCEPDFDAWSGSINRAPKPSEKFMRSAGGHIHVETNKDPEMVVRNADLFLGIPSLFMDEGEDRRKLYGKPGAHRKKSYGVEYRVLSNFWIFDEKYIRWAWRNMERALSFDGDVRKYQQNILDAINNNNKTIAEKLIHDFALEVV